MFSNLGNSCGSKPYLTHGHYRWMMVLSNGSSKDGDAYTLDVIFEEPHHLNLQNHGQFRSQVNLVVRSFHYFQGNDKFLVIIEMIG